MSIADQITRLTSARDGIRSELMSRGVSASAHGFEDFASDIAAIPSGGGGMDALVDGTISIASGGASVIRPYAFYSCSALTEASFPSCTTIGSSAFQGCGNLTSVSFPSCASINSSAFYLCNKITSVDFPVCSMISSQAFYGCSSLVSLSFPMCETIKSSAFAFCRSLPAVSFPACLEINTSAFYNCSALSAVNLPVCSNIMTNAFGSCSNLTMVILGCSSKCRLSTNAFSSTQVLSEHTGAIFVPASLYEEYVSSYSSYRFASIENYPSVIGAFPSFTLVEWSHYTNLLYSYGGISTVSTTLTGSSTVQYSFYSSYKINSYTGVFSPYGNASHIQLRNVTVGGTFHFYSAAGKVYSVTSVSIISTTSRRLYINPLIASAYSSTEWNYAGSVKHILPDEYPDDGYVGENDRYVKIT